VDRDLLNDGRIHGSVLQFLFGSGGSQHGQVFHLVEHVPAVEQATKDGVQIVEVGLSFVADEKLGAIRVGACSNNM